MKTKTIKKVAINNRKKQMEVSYSSGRKVTFHFGQIGIKENIKRTWVDSETGGRSIGIEYESGLIDYMPYDQPLALVRDPEFLLQTQIEILTSKIKEHLRKKGLSKKFLSERLNTSVNQIQRLLNPKILNKNLEQLFLIASLLDLEFELRLKKAS